MLMPSLRSALDLLPTKLSPPRAASVLVPCGAALRRIDHGVSGKLVLVTAPLGSGKTTLLTQWYREARVPHLLAWLSLDEQDNAPERFFAYLVGAIRRAAPDFDAYSTSQPEHATAVILQSLWSLGRELVVVLDDFHVLRERPLVRAFSYLLDHSPPHVHWVVSSRNIPELDLAKLKLTEQLVTLDGRDLNLDGEAIRELGLRLCGAVLTPEDIDSLRTRTEGWVAGVKLALLSAGEHASVSDALRKAIGSNHDVARYLADAVLREQPEEVREFLVLSSVVEQLHGALCNALLGITRGHTLLGQLERSQLFIQALDTERQWYRYHPLFLDVLRAQLACDYADRIPRLHRAASAWFAENQMPDEALTHAFASEDRDWCLALTARCMEAWMREGELASVLHWTAKLTAQEVIRSPAICVGHIACLILSRRFAHATAALRDAQHHLDTADEVSAPERERLTKRLAHLTLLHAVLSDSAPDTGMDLDASPGSEESDVFIAGAVLAAKAYRALRMNRFDAMRRLALSARETLQGHNNPFLVGYTDVLVALADRAQGNMKDAAARCEEAFERASRGRRNPVWANAATALANARYEQNRLDEAEALCVEVLPLLPQASVFETFALAYLMLARIKTVRGKYAEAYRLLDYLHGVLECGHQTRFLAHVCGEKIRLYLVEQAPARMRVVAQEFGLGERMRRGEWSEKRFYDETWERLGLAQAWVLMARGRHDKAHAILEVLRASAHEVGYVSRETALLATIAVCHWRAGDAMAAFAALNRGFALAQRFGFGRSVFDETPGLQEVVIAAARQRKLSYAFPDRYATRYQDLLSAGTRVPREFAAPPSAPLEPLTERELQMLKLLAQGLSNQEISERSNVALSTTKWHLRNVFAKLDVTTRTAAIVKAQERLQRHL
ncbi:transcriptional regulator, LuxR family [Myxococcus xanthus DK 1622]|uniref:Transcriptional regulator, LuxR family n=2 Tax=Myxococcaceae TaxID=31 RepID=Q1D1L7_MYXXD|nr:transcriptional regulator, LuxR family [Myxococcus xanthus DK 1622]NOJ53689.1 LuxR family transcriptional regulator [Myxococcus xanthus]QPM77779.1 LuxR family transcriptional regulator [Myxococcus xanthus]QVW66847.1 LuxR family transcriptional regulator [Myxococcus xanthus DZ2]UEO07025.1 LuxR C-terminal-related transcriptional regulator [Myxococcus xanthus DZ2]